MKLKLLLPLICVASLASCASIPGDSVTGSGLVENGVAFSEAAVRDSVPEQTKSQIEESVIGAVMTSTTKISTSINMNGQKQSSSQTVSVIEEYDFVNKKLTATQKAGGQKIVYTVELVGEDVHFSSQYITEDDLVQQGYDVTYAGWAALFEQSFKSLFSFHFYPSDDELESLREIYSSLGLGEGYADFVENIYNQMLESYVMAGDLETGDAEFGLAEPLTLNMIFLGYDTKITYNKLKVVYKDYLAVEAVTSISESLSFSYQSEEYSYFMDIKVGISTSSKFSYIFAE